DRRHITGSNLFPTDEAHFRRFNHCVGCFDHRDETARLNHAKGLTQGGISLTCHLISLSSKNYFKFETTLSIKSISSVRVREIVSDTPSVKGHIGSFGLASESSSPKYFCR